MLQTGKTGDPIPADRIGHAEADHEEADTSTDGFLDSQRDIIGVYPVQHSELLPVGTGLFGSPLGG